MKTATDACVLASNNASPAQRGPRRDAQPPHATPLAAVLCSALGALGVQSLTSLRAWRGTPTPLGVLSGRVNPRLLGRASARLRQLFPQQAGRTSFLYQLLFRQRRAAAPKLVAVDSHLLYTGSHVVGPLHGGGGSGVLQDPRRPLRRRDVPFVHVPGRLRFHMRLLR